jgi:hypothetical protein
MRTDKKDKTPARKSRGFEFQRHVHDKCEAVGVENRPIKESAQLFEVEPQI